MEASSSAKLKEGTICGSCRGILLGPRGEDLCTGSAGFEKRPGEEREVELGVGVGLAAGPVIVLDERSPDLQLAALDAPGQVQTRRLCPERGWR